jgi:ABC-type sugar transport system permease subunit
MYLLFYLYPFANSFFLSLTNWNGADPVKEYVGLANYGAMLKDKVFWESLSHNLVWMAGMSTIPIFIGLVLAVLLWKRPPGFTLFRTFYFMPQVLGASVIGIIWKWIYMSRKGILAQLGDRTGLEFLKHGWLGDTNTALPAVLLANIWAGIGFFFVIMLAGLQNVDKDLIDAAQVDGANAIQRFRHIVIPQLSNVITMVTVLALIGGLNVFDIVWSMTEGGPANATELIGTYTYTKAFLENNVGYASALTMVMTLLALVTTVVFIRLRESREG